MKNTSNIIRLLLLTLVVGLKWSSCTEVIDIELDSTYTRPVIFGQITTDTTVHRVTITSTGDYFKNSPPQGISGADVEIFDGTTYYPLNESETEKGVYLTQPNFYGEVGKTYTLLVSNLDLLGDGVLTSHSASSTILPLGDVDSIRVVYRQLWQGWEVQGFAKDPADTRDFYKFLIYINNELQTDSLSNYSLVDDTFFNGEYTNGVTITFFSDRRGAVSEGDTITVGFCG
ncbi:MAG: DUF4249 family protein, partial [Tenuifilaceae bacterium]|nr:DUF4249 family protein [Tenuifilaceae bacterium]